MFIKCIRRLSTAASKVPATKSDLAYIPSFREYNFIPPIYEVLDKKELFTPTPIQQQVIPNLLASKSIFFTAQNGTGKTLAYGLPLIHLLKEQEENTTPPQKPRALVVVPSRELALQTKEVLKEFAHKAKFRVTSFFGGEKIGIEYRALRTGLDILVSTPERLDTHRKKSTFFISDITHLIIDEFDTLIDSGYKDTIDVYVEKTLRRNPMQKQLVFLSSTHPKHVDNTLLTLEKKHSISLKRIIDQRSHTNLANLEHYFEEIRGTDKFPALLKHVKKLQKTTSAIIFCNSIKCAQATEHFLREHGINSTSLHGDIPHVHRYHNYLKFKLQEAPILVATDVAARGLDFPFVTHVINFDYPETESDYLHRAGRAGRAGKKGYVITLYKKRNKESIERLTRAFNTGTPLDIRDSTFSKVNKEDVQRDPKLLIEGKKARAEARVKAEERRVKKESEDKKKMRPKEKVLNYKLKPKKEKKKGGPGLGKIRARDSKTKERLKKAAMKGPEKGNKRLGRKKRRSFHSKPNRNGTHNKT